MLAAGAPIDGFGIGTSLTTSSDVPALDCAYKLQEYARTHAAQAIDWEGHVARPQAGLASVWGGWPNGRRYRVGRERRTHRQSLIQLVMQGGRRVGARPTLSEMRTRAARDLDRLPNGPAPAGSPTERYPVQVADVLIHLAAEVDRRLEAQSKSASVTTGFTSPRASDLEIKIALATGCGISSRTAVHTRHVPVERRPSRRLSAKTPKVKLGATTSTD